MKMLGGAGTVLVSKEAGTYRPEMEYLARLSEGKLRVAEAETFTSRPMLEGPARLYRFFELFDLPNIPAAQWIMQAAEVGRAEVTPPIKPYLEEKLWFALFWLRPLREYWRRELSERHFLELQKVIPYTWLLDPTPLYGPLVEALQCSGVDLHYAVHVTGHGWRKLMRAERELTYRITALPPVLPIFDFIQRHAVMSPEAMYGTFNMGAGYALYLPERAIAEATRVAADAGFELLDAGRIELGEKKVVLQPLGTAFAGASLQIRS